MIAFHSTSRYASSGDTQRVSSMTKAPEMTATATDATPIAAAVSAAAKITIASGAELHFQPGRIDPAEYVEQIAFFQRLHVLRRSLQQQYVSKAQSYLC